MNVGKIGCPGKTPRENVHFITRIVRRAISQLRKTMRDTVARRVRKSLLVCVCMPELFRRFFAADAANLYNYDLNALTRPLAWPYSYVGCARAGNGKWRKTVRARRKACATATATAIRAHAFATFLFRSSRSRPRIQKPSFCRVPRGRPRKPPY